MKNPVNRLATAAPRALDSLLRGGEKKEDEKKTKQQQQQQNKARTCSFDLDLSLLDTSSSGSSVTGSSSVGLSGGSIAEECCGGSVMTFEDLSEFTLKELSLDEPSPN